MLKQATYHLASLSLSGVNCWSKRKFRQTRRELTSPSEALNRLFLFAQQLTGEGYFTIPRLGPVNWPTCKGGVGVELVVKGAEFTIEKKEKQDGCLTWERWFTTS